VPDPRASLHWHNLSLAIRIKVSVGAALVLVFVPGFFAILVISKWVAAVAANLLLVLSAWTVGVGGYAFHDYKQSKLDVDAASGKNGDITAALTKLKLAKLGIQETAAEPCAPAGPKV
jgi:hypothetical protein